MPHHSPRAMAARALSVLTLGAVAVAVPPGTANATPVPTCAAANIGVTSLGGPNFYIDSGSSPEFRSGYTGYRVTNGTGVAMGDVWLGLSGFSGGSLALASGQAPAQRGGDLAPGASAARFWYMTAAGTSNVAQQHTVTVYSHNPALPNAVALCTTVDGFSSVQGTLAASANKVTGISVTGEAPKLGSLFTVTVEGNTGVIGQGIAGDAQSLWMTPAVTEHWPASAYRLVSTRLTISPDGTAPEQTYTDTLRVAGLGDKARPYRASYTFQAVGFSAAPATVKPVQQIASGTQVKHTGSYSVALPAIQPAVNDLSLDLTSSPVKVDHGGGTVTLTAAVTGTPGAELDAFTLTLPTGATVVPGSVRWGGAAGPDPVTSAGKVVVPGPFVVGPDRLTLQVDFDGTPGNRRATVVGNIATAQIGATTSPTDGSNAAEVTVNVDTAPTAGDHHVTTAPGVPVSVNTANLVTDADNDLWTVTSTGPAAHGTVTVEGRRLTYTPADGYHGPDSFTYTVDDGRGGTATGTINVSVDPEADPDPDPPTDRAPQTIGFEQPGDLQVDGRAELGADASSGLPVTFTSDTPEVCAVEGTSVTALAAGTCAVTARQDGDADWAAAAPVTRSFTVTPSQAPDGPDPAPQTIAFAPPADVLGTATAYDLTATASSGLPVALDVTGAGCAIAGVALSATAPGTCVVTATQAGDASHAAALPVTREIRFVAPGDDLVSTRGATPVTVDVLANDPGGVGLVGFTAPAHGEVTAVGDKLRYTPAGEFRGTDRFTYTVGLGGRTAVAEVLVTVANQAPSVKGARMQQPAGTARVVTLAPRDPNGDRVTVTARTSSRQVGATVSGNRLRITATPEASGDVTVTVTVTDEAGATGRAVVRVRITPPPPQAVGRRLSGEGTTARWTAAPTAGARYEVVHDGRVVCRTAGTSCSWPAVAGPQHTVRVRTLGRDGTVSSRVGAPLTGRGEVLITTVYFAPDSDRLTPRDRRILDRAISKIQRYGFGRAEVDGFTDADGGASYNLALSKRRTGSTARYLWRHGDIGSRQSWHGELSPVASNDAASGKARNRRVEILVRY